MPNNPTDSSLIGIRVRVPALHGEPPTTPGTIVLDLGGPPENVVVGVRLRAAAAGACVGGLVFRGLWECVVWAGEPEAGGGE